MTITEIKKWAKQHGYEVIKEKDNTINGHSYYWSHIDNPQATGVSLSVSKLARDIFNSITDNCWVDHQENYQKNKEIAKFNISDY